MSHRLLRPPWLPEKGLQWVLAALGGDPGKPFHRGPHRPPFCHPGSVSSEVKALGRLALGWPRCGPLWGSPAFCCWVSLCTCSRTSSSVRSPSLYHRSAVLTPTPKIPVKSCWEGEHSRVRVKHSLQGVQSHTDPQRGRHSVVTRPAQCCPHLHLSSLSSLSRATRACRQGSTPSLACAAHPPAGSLERTRALASSGNSVPRPCAAPACDANTSHLTVADTSLQSLTHSELNGSS